MSGNKDRAPWREYAGPSFYKIPSANSLPIPKFAKRSSTVSCVSIQLILRAQKNPLGAVNHIKQASSHSEKSSSKRKSVSFTSETKPHDGKRAQMAVMELDKPIDMVRGIAYRCSMISCLIHQIYEPETTLRASIQRNEGFEKLAKRIREDNEAQVKRNKAQYQELEMMELQQCQQVIVDHIEQKFTKVVIRYTLQEIFDIRDHKSTIPANVRRQARLMQQILRKQNIQEMWAETTHLLHLVAKRLGQDLAKQEEISQQRLNEIRDMIKEEAECLADDDLGLTSSSNEGSLASTDDDITLVDDEIDGDEYHHGEVSLPRNFSLVAISMETIVEETEETVFYGKEACQEKPEVKGMRKEPRTGSSTGNLRTRVTIRRMRWWKSRKLRSVSLWRRRNNAEYSIAGHLIFLW